MRRSRQKTPQRKAEANAVSSYEHLGSIIDASGNQVPEARNRERSAMNFFASLTKQALGSKMLGIQDYQASVVVDYVEPFLRRPHLVELHWPAAANTLWRVHPHVETYSWRPPLPEDPLDR